MKPVIKVGSTIQLKRKRFLKAYFKEFIHNISISVAELFTFLTLHIFTHSFGESDRQEWVSKL